MMDFAIFSGVSGILGGIFLVTGLPLVFLVFVACVGTTTEKSH